MSAATTVTTNFFEQVFGIYTFTGGIVISYPDPTKPRADGSPSWISAQFPNVASAAVAARKLAAKHDVYFGVGLRGYGLREGRGAKKDVRVLPAFYADADVAGPNHANTGKVYFSSREAVLAFADSLPLRPSLIVWSGGGAHLYWILREPWTLDSAEERSAADLQLKAWGRYLKAKAKESGVDLDPVQELARVLRVPGTLNHKTGEPAPVEVIHDSGLRFNVSDFAELAPVKDAAPNDQAVVNVAVDPNAELPDKIKALLANDPRARATWDRNRPDLSDPTDSGYCMALANAAVAVGWSDQEIADLLVAWRRKVGAKKKGSVFYTTTIETARTSQGTRPATPNNGMDESESAGKATQTDTLLQLVKDMVLWTTPDSVAFATIASEDGHREHWPVRSRTFRLALQQRFFDHGGRAPSSHAMTDALGTIEALARNSGEQHEVAVRMAEYGDKLYLDLGSPQWQAVEIDAAGWRVVANPPVRFRRSRGMLPLPVPVAGGSLDALRPFVPGGEATFRLILGWLVQAIRAAGPYMILVLVGEQGTGKSLLARLLRQMIDPNTVVLRSVPREERDLAITATNSYVVAIDNISGLPVWLSDGICRIASGAGFATRELYSDDEETLLSATRPVILNGIDDVASRGDILDRSILVTLPTIDDGDRRDEREIVAAFDVAAPALLGALCTAVSTAVSRRDKVKLARLPRMADATLWIVAAEPTLPWEAGGFLEAYTGNRAEAVAVALEADSVAGAVLRLMSNKLSWTGTAGDLLAALGKLVDDPKPRDWPGNPRALSARLVRLAPALRAVGWEAHKGKVNGARGISIERVRDRDAKPQDRDATPGTGTQNPPPENVGGNGKRDAKDAKDAKIPPLFNFPVEEKEGEREEKRVEVEICTE